MKRIRLEEATVDELVDRFAEIGVAQDRAELRGKISKYNSLYRQMDAVDQELRRRGTTARLALLELSHSFPQAMDAGMTLRNLAAGVFKPD